MNLWNSTRLYSMSVIRQLAISSILLAFLVAAMVATTSKRRFDRTCFWNDPSILALLWRAGSDPSLQATIGSDGSLRKVFAQMDKNSDGKIHCGEFAPWAFKLHVQCCEGLTPSPFFFPFFPCGQVDSIAVPLEAPPVPALLPRSRTSSKESAPWEEMKNHRRL